MVYLGDERLDLEPLGTTRIRPAGGAARRSVCEIGPASIRGWHRASDGS